MDQLSARVRVQGESLSPPLYVGVYGKFVDGRVPDLDNLSKVILDSLKVGTGVDDKHMRFVAVGYDVGYESPVLEIEIREVS